MADLDGPRAADRPLPCSVRLPVSSVTSSGENSRLAWPRASVRFQEAKLPKRDDTSRGEDEWVAITRCGSEPEPS